jgi:hypothetical protein
MPLYEVLVAEVARWEDFEHLVRGVEASLTAEAGNGSGGVFAAPSAFATGVANVLSLG